MLCRWTGATSTPTRSSRATGSSASSAPASAKACSRSGAKAPTSCSTTPLPGREDPRRRSELRHGLVAGACGLGARGLRLPCRDLAALRRHLPQQLPEDRSRAGGAPPARRGAHHAPSRTTRRSRSSSTSSTAASPSRPSTSTSPSISTTTPTTGCCTASTTSASRSSTTTRSLATSPDARTGCRGWRLGADASAADIPGLRRRGLDTGGPDDCRSGVDRSCCGGHARARRLARVAGPATLEGPAASSRAVAAARLVRSGCACPRRRGGGRARAHSPHRERPDPLIGPGGKPARPVRDGAGGHPQQRPVPPAAGAALAEMGPRRARRAPAPVHQRLEWKRTRILWQAPAPQA